MEVLNYIIQKGDTLASVAEAHGISPKELIRFHNQNCTVTQYIIENAFPWNLAVVYIEIKIVEEIILDKRLEREIKYRCEQNISTKVNNIPVSNAVIKRDYLVTSKWVDNKLFVKIKLLDHSLAVNPTQYREAADMVVQLDFIKCDDVIVQVDKKNGDILRIVNHEEIVEKWNYKKNELLGLNRKLKNDTARQDLQDFVALVDKQITDEKNLIKDYDSKILFDVYFCEFLVDSPSKLDDFEGTLTSQLFEGHATSVKFYQQVLKESSTQILVLVESKTLNKDTKHIAKLYDKRYKPLIDYAFSSYEISYTERSLYNETDNYLEETDITMVEQVVNNLELRIHYTIRKIE